MNYKQNLRVFILILSIVTLSLFGGCQFLNKENDKINGTNDSTKRIDGEDDNETEEDQPEPDPEPDPEPEPETFTNIRIAAAGDIMFHMSQITSGLNDETGNYDFTSVFTDVKPYFTEADLALANYETTAAGAERGFSGYPIFNAPDETIDAIKDAGIDVLTTANNHSLDTGSTGLKRTVQVIREKGLQSVGTYDEKPDSRVLMIDVKGVDVAIIAYTESTNGLGAQYAEDELSAMLNVMDESIIKEDIQEAHDRDADLIIALMHWGIEYAPNPNETQVQFAEMMAEEGVDIILGSHPHVIQESDFLHINENETFVIYSMGNFVSNQRRETLGAGYEPTEDGVIVQIDIEKNDQTEETVIKDVAYVPTWVYRDKTSDASKYTYRILPIDDFRDDSDFSKTFRDRMHDSYDATVGKMKPMPKEES